MLMQDEGSKHGSQSGFEEERNRSKRGADSLHRLEVRKKTNSGDSDGDKSKKKRVIPAQPCQEGNMSKDRKPYRTHELCTDVRSSNKEDDDKFNRTKQKASCCCHYGADLTDQALAQYRTEGKQKSAGDGEKYSVNIHVTRKRIYDNKDSQKRHNKRPNIPSCQARFEDENGKN